MKRQVITILLLILGLANGFAQHHHVGDLIVNDDGSRGVVYYVNPDGSGGWMVALEDAASSCQWGDHSDVPNLSDNAFNWIERLRLTDGHLNTQILVGYQNSSEYAAGKVDLQNGWYLPSIGQLRRLWSLMPTLTPSIVIAGGIPMSGSVNYWSSTEKNANEAYACGTTLRKDDQNGLACFFVDKLERCSVRAIRDFDYNEIVYDTTLTYLWSTGSTQPYIEVTPDVTTNYWVTVISQTGCSVTAEQTIFVNPGELEEEYDTICSHQPYSGYGFTLSESETVSAGDTILSRIIGSGDCEGTLRLYLHKRGSVYGTVVEDSFCEGGRYTYNGQSYSFGGTYFQHYLADNGCDSIVTLNLTEMPVPEMVIHGVHQAAVADDQFMGIYEYYVDSAYLDVSRLHWALDRDDWMIEPHGYGCTIVVLTPGIGTLHAWTMGAECNSDTTFLINATFFGLGDEQAPRVQIYPNPARDKVAIEADDMQRLSVFNLMGQMLVDCELLAESRIELPVGQLPRGIYVFKIADSLGHVIIRKVVME